MSPSPPEVADPPAEGTQPAAEGSVSRPSGDSPWAALLDLEPLPTALIDLDAVDHNAAAVIAALGGRELCVRLVTAEMRSTGVLRHLFTTGPRALQGLHVSSVGEAVLLAELGFDDLLIGVPPARPAEAEQIAALAARGVQVITVVDADVHLQLLHTAAEEAGVELPICLEVDTTYQPVAELVLGLRRSALADSEEARQLAARAVALGGLRVVGVMAWEAAIAALQTGRHPWAWGPLRSLARRRSAQFTADRRGAVVQALRDDGHPIALVNGGSSASLDLVAADPSLTEISVGAAILSPGRAELGPLQLRPAVHYAVPVCRRPDAETAVVAGGGWLAGGPGASTPTVVWPPHLQATPPHGWGEVYSVLRATAGEVRAQVGDPVVCRPAAVGPMMERLNEVLLHRGAERVERAPTYRGLGLQG